MRRPSLLFVPLFTAFLAAGCAGHSGGTSFKGVWNVEKTNGISGEVTPSRVAVTVDGNRFQLDARDADSETLDIYDGKLLRHRRTVADVPDTQLPPPPAESRTEPKSDLQVEAMRFWKREFTGNGMAGGQIAGRDTLLFQSREEMMDGEMTIQAWVDAETRVVLKKVFTIYSSQIDQVVSRTLEECIEIHYGPVDPSAFAPPV